MAQKPRKSAQNRSNKGRRFPAEPLTDAEIERLIAAIKGSRPIAVRNRALIMLLWRSGLRISEALALRPSDIEGGKVNVRNGKGSKQRIAYFDDIAVPYLQAWEGVRETLGVGRRQPLFCTISNGEKRAAGAPLDSSYMRQYLPRLARRAGIDKRVHAHGFRHSYASALSMERAPMPVISAALGHENEATTAAYTRKLQAPELYDGLRRLGRTVTY
jgi:integrase